MRPIVCALEPCEMVVQWEWEVVLVLVVNPVEGLYKLGEGKEKVEEIVTLLSSGCCGTSAHCICTILGDAARRAHGFKPGNARSSSTTLVGKSLRRQGRLQVSPRHHWLVTDSVSNGTPTPPNVNARTTVLFAAPALGRRNTLAWEGESTLKRSRIRRDC